MYNSRFSSIVWSLLLRYVCDMAAHGCRRDEGAVALLFEPFPSGPGRVVNAVEISGDYLVVHFVLFF